MLEACSGAASSVQLSWGQRMFCSLVSQQYLRALLPLGRLLPAVGFDQETLPGVAFPGAAELRVCQGSAGVQLEGRGHRAPRQRCHKASCCLAPAVAVPCASAGWAMPAGIPGRHSRAGPWLCPQLLPVPRAQLCTSHCVPPSGCSQPPRGWALGSRSQGHGVPI